MQDNYTTNEGLSSLAQASDSIALVCYGIDDVNQKIASLDTKGIENVSTSATEAQKEVLSLGEQLSESLNIGDKLSSFFSDFSTDLLTGEKQLGDFVSSVKSFAVQGLRSSSQSAISSITDDLFGDIGGWFKDIFTPLASGGAFSSGFGEIPVEFASQATPVGLADHGLGVIGEAGPEAVLPLSRGPDGKLGVSSHYGERSGGWSAPIVFNVTTPDAGSFRRSEGQITAMLARASDRGRRNL